MASLYPTSYFRDALTPTENAQLSVASSAVLYGLSVYTVFPLTPSPEGPLAFRLPEHHERLVRSARIIGIDTFEHEWPFEKFVSAMRELVKANAPEERAFVRVTVHVDALVPGTRSRGLSSVVSAFIYPGTPIIPPSGARLKTSVWRRIPDYAIPSRAKVNGAYVNSVLAKQDALDSGYDDCIFLDVAGHVCELSAANIFLVREGTLITPSADHDILEGITRRTILESARHEGIPVLERTVDLTELYIAEEVFASGTSANVTPILDIDARTVGDGTMGPITARLQALYRAALSERSALTTLVA